MPKRIPHSDNKVISGEKTTRNYLEMQKKFGKFYFKDFLAKFDKLSKGGRFLEIGPGPGYQTAVIAERYKPDEITGLEYSTDMINVAEEYILKKGMYNKVKFINGAVENTQLIKRLGKFDVVYSTFSLHHWTDPLLGIQNLFNCLNEKGVLYLYDFYRGGIFYYLKIKRGVWESIRASYTIEEIENILKKLNIQSYELERKGLYKSCIVKRS